jgi:hypothetical protein
MVNMPNAKNIYILNGININISVNSHIFPFIPMEGFHLNIPQNVQLVTDLKNNKSV